MNQCSLGSKMDPLEGISEDIWPMIFQHLSVRDILRATLVSPAWENAIGECNSCMKNVWLRFYWPLDDEDSLMRSERKYQNFKMQRNMPTKLDQIFNKFQWKQVMMRDCMELTRIDFVNMMEKLSSSVEKLEIWDVRVQESEVLSPIDFPQLTTLDTNLSSYQVIETFLGKNPCLTKVKLSGYGAQINETGQDRRDLMKIFHKFLQHNPQIKHLNLDSADNFCGGVVEYFASAVPNLKFLELT